MIIATEARHPQSSAVAGMSAGLSILLRTVVNRILYLPLFAPHLGGKVFTLDQGNPGVGGSQFTTIQFGMLFAHANPDWSVVIGNHEPIDIGRTSPNLSQIQEVDLTAFYRALPGLPAGVVLSMSIHFWKADPSLILGAPGTPIIWSRHPFDDALRLREVRCRAVDVVCVGEYQWYSNNLRRHRTHFIEEIFVPTQAEARANRSDPSAPPRAVHVSSLVRAKGFLEIAKAWPSLRKAIPGVVLEVVGGQNLYGLSTQHDLIPTDPEFAREILQHIPAEDICSGAVKFHGTMGFGKVEVLQRCDFALLNPTGSSEAFPATPLECMSEGLPVVASDDYGMADTMRYFPELSLRRPDEISRRVLWLLSSPGRIAEFRSRAISVAREFASHAEDSLRRWRILLEAARNGDCQKLAFKPSKSRHGSSTTYFHRRYLRPSLKTIRMWTLQRQSANRVKNRF